MNSSYVPVRKFFKIASSTQRNPKHERRSLQECLDSSKGSRRRCRWNPWVVLSCLLTTAIYLYWHRISLPTANKQMMNQIHYSTSPHDNIETSEDVSPTFPCTKKKLLLNPTTSEKAVKDFYSFKDSLKSGQDKRRKPNDLPHCFRKKPYPKFEIKLKSVDLSQQNVYPLVRKGGSYQPSDCKTKFKVGILVPYRNRKRSLGTFLYNIHPFLMQQKLSYQIFVIEQDGDEPFNKGRVYNAGFNEMMKFNNFHCVVLHDVDLLPLDSNIAYSCPTLPRHMCARVNDTAMKQFDKTYQFQSLFGGVVSMTTEQFRRANGFSNLYFGWGGEDNDMFWRLRAAGYPVVRYNRTIAVYLVMAHQREPANPIRHHLLSRAMDRYKVDGLSNSEYYVISTKFRPLYTHIVVNINPRNDNITVLNSKWA